jgi:hypothetical protein
MADVDINLRVKSDAAAVKSTGLKFTELSSAIGLAKQAFAVVKGVADEVIGSFTSYAKTVEDMARVTGSGAEETSRLIQVADDLQISTTDLSTALAGAVRKGINPSVESIAALSDEYLALAPGLDRSKFLMDNFGRSGLAMARLMEQGSDAILEMGAAVDDSLIITEDAIKANQDYYASLDAMNDAAEGAKIALGQFLVPWLTKASEAVMITVNGFKAVKTALEANNQTLATSAGSYDEYLEGLKEQETALTNVNKALNFLTAGMIPMVDTTDEMTEAEWSYIKTLDEIREKTPMAAEQTWVWSDALHQMVPIADDATGSVGNLGLTLDDVKSSFNELTTEMIFNAAAENLTADEAMKLAVQMGLVNAETLGYQASMEELNAQLASGEISALQYRDAVAALGQQIEDEANNPHTITVTVRMDDQELNDFMAQWHDLGAVGPTVGQLPGMGGQIPEARANGGPVVAGRPYIVGERGPEVVVPQQAGYVIPNQGSVTSTYNIIINGNASANDIIRRARIADAYGV